VDFPPVRQQPLGRQSVASQSSWLSLHSSISED
jgi:hypothetical protein